MVNASGAFVHPRGIILEEFHIAVKAGLGCIKLAPSLKSTFGYQGTTDSLFLVNLVAVLISLLMPDNMDAMVEACRVFGNFSRSKEVRALLAEHKGRWFFSEPHHCYDIFHVKFISYVMKYRYNITGLCNTYYIEQAKQDTFFQTFTDVQVFSKILGCHNDLENVVYNVKLINANI